MGDIKVEEAQKWYNATYKGKAWYQEIAEDGVTGNTTCNALSKALQYEIGMTSGIDGIIGPGTINACPIIGKNTTNKNLIKILQCGFYCKGYECGDISGIYTDATIKAAKAFCKDVGFPDAIGTMSGLFMKALLNTDAYILIQNGSEYVRNAQKFLNNTYFINMGTWGFIPCNGITDRNMMKGVIAALQYEEAGKSMKGVDGIYGNNTLANAPILAQGTDKSAYVKLAQICLMCMMNKNPGLTGVFDSSLVNAIKDFQNFYCLSMAESGKIDRVTWASLLSSKGETSRKAQACDTSYKITGTIAKSLYINGYRYVGRYLTGTVGQGNTKRDKSLSIEELNTIFYSGLKTFAIFQEGAVNPEKFTYEQGKKDAQKAFDAATGLGIPYGEFIYFAIDYDMMDEQVTKYVVPYFKGIRRIFNSNYNRYRVGIYGSRNVCSRVSKKGYATSSFVSDMSSGYSGNLGYKLPDNWAFDQFFEFSYKEEVDEKIDLDKVAYSGRYSGFNTLEEHSVNDIIIQPSHENLIDRYRELLKINNITPPINLALEKKFVVDVPIMNIEYTAKINSDFEEDDTCTYTKKINVTNGQFDSLELEEAKKICEKYTTSYSAQFEAMGGLTLSTTISEEIGNGSIKMGFGVSNGYFMVIYNYETLVWKDSDNVKYILSLEIKITYRNISTPEAFKEKMEALGESAKVFGIIFCAYLGVYAPSKIGEAIIALMSLVLKALA